MCAIIFLPGVKKMKKTLIISCFACTGKNFACEILKKEGKKVACIEKDENFYKLYPTKDKFIKKINELSKENEIIFIPYFLKMEERYFQGSLEYYLVFPESFQKSEFEKRFKNQNFTKPQTENLLNNWDKMMQDFKTCLIKKENKFELKNFEYVIDIVQKLLYND